MAYAVAAESAPRVTSHLAREMPTHALMIGVMVVSMLADSSAVSVAGAAVLVGASIVCAALSRTRTFLREHVADLWAMALVLLVYLPSSGAPATAHGHLLLLTHEAAFALVAVLWMLSRVWIARSRSEWRMSLASGVVTAAGLVVMAAFCA